MASNYHYTHGLAHLERLATGEEQHAADDAVRAAELELLAAYEAGEELDDALMAVLLESDVKSIAAARNDLRYLIEAASGDGSGHRLVYSG